MNLIILSVVYLLSYMAAAREMYFISGAVMLLAAVYLYYAFYKKSGMILCPAALFSIAWIGGQGASALKLSKLQIPWENKTWLCFYVISISFFAVYELVMRHMNKSVDKSADKMPDREAQEDKTEEVDIRLRAVRNVMCIIALLSVVAFATEAVLLGYIPLFTVDTPHAYSYFHISGVHYFTVSCVMLPSLAVIYMFEVKKKYEQQLSGKELCIKVLMNSRLALFMLFMGVFIPVLLVSRFQMLFGMILAGFTLLLLRNDSFKTLVNRKTLPFIATAVLGLVIVYVYITIERAHSVEYLNGIFEMKNPNTPIWITQPYIYIAHNFDNFNCLIRELPEFSKGLKMLFPFFALTGLKFLRPELVAFPLYVTKAELTTLTLFYDAYYDFGIVGCALFAMLLAAVTAYVAHRLKIVMNGKQSINPILYLIAAQLLFYCLFAFFTTWYSNPATWFYLILSLAIYLYTFWYIRKEGSRLK